MWKGDNSEDAIKWLEREFEKRWARTNFCCPLDKEKTVFYYGCKPPRSGTGLMVSIKDDEGYHIIVVNGKERRL